MVKDAVGRDIDVVKHMHPKWNELLRSRFSYLLGTVSYLFFYWQQKLQGIVVTGCVPHIAKSTPNAISGGHFNRI